MGPRAPGRRAVIGDNVADAEPDHRRAGGQAAHPRADHHHVADAAAVHDRAAAPTPCRAVPAIPGPASAAPPARPAPPARRSMRSSRNIVHAAHQDGCHRKPIDSGVRREGRMQTDIIAELAGIAAGTGPRAQGRPDGGEPAQRARRHVARRSGRPVACRAPRHRAPHRAAQRQRSPRRALRNWRGHSAAPDARWSAILRHVGSGDHDPRTPRGTTSRHCAPPASPRPTSSACRNSLLS